MFISPDIKLLRKKKHNKKRAHSKQVHTESQLPNPHIRQYYFFMFYYHNYVQLSSALLRL